jgi:hypothetical protein
LSEEQKQEIKPEQSKEEEVYPQRKMDVKALAAVVPPATSLFSRQKVLQEKRIRVRYGEVEENQIKINPQLASQLGIIDTAVLVVAGKKRFTMNVIIDEDVPMDIVIANPQLMKDNGVADNSIATIRKS